MAHTPARKVLDTQTGLYELLKRPPREVLKFYQEFIRRGAELAAREDTDPVVAAGWLSLFEGISSGAELLTVVGRPLYDAATYQVTEEMCEAVNAMYLETAAKTAHARAQDLPSPAGFVWLDKPASLIDSFGRRISNRAMSWGPQTGNYQGELWPGVRVTAWSTVDDFAEHDDDAQVHEALAAFGEVFLSYSVFVPYGQRFAIAEVDEPGTGDLVRWLHCLWLFMDTEIVVTRRGEVDRAARRRAQKSLKHDEVRVVLLRRATERGEPSGMHHDIDWSCRWVVQGFDRHLGDYRAAGFRSHEAKPMGPGKKCVTCGLVTTHVRAFIKGPPGKPLKNPQKLYKLAR